MLNFIKKLFGTEKPVATEAKTTLEFHEEIRQQVEAEPPFPVAEQKPATPAKAKKPVAKKAPAKATAKKAPAKSNKQ
jgi:hypothetical protein